MTDKPDLPAQVEANRANARKSTGPKDTALTRLNAVKHGLLSNEVLMKDEDGKALAGLGERMRKELSPKGELENILVDRIVSSIWRLKRALRIERQYLESQSAGEQSNLLAQLGRQDPLLALAPHAMPRETRVADWMSLNRYESAIERQIYKALHELQRIQSEKRGEKPPLPISVDVDISKES